MSTSGSEAEPPPDEAVRFERLLADMLGRCGGRLRSMEMVIPHADGMRVLPSGALARWSRD